MSGIMTTADWGLMMWPGINSVYGVTRAEYPEEYRELFDIFSSRKHTEEDVGASMFGLARVKDEGAAVEYDSGSQGFRTRYTHVEYALGFAISRILMEDDLYDVVGNARAQALAFSMRQTKETVAANVYNRAFNASYTGGDGKEMIASDHPRVAGGTWSNEASTPVALSEAALEQACIDIARFTDDRGNKAAYKPVSLIITPELEFTAARILKSEGRVGTSNNDINVLNLMGKFRKVVVNHYLTDTNAWFIRTDCPNGMKLFERRADDFDMDNDFDTDNAKFKATMRFSAGWTDPRGIYGSEGA